MAISNISKLRHVLFGIWDSKHQMFKIIEFAKMLFGLDFQNYQFSGFAQCLIKYYLRQMRKKASYLIEVTRGPTL